MNEPAALNTTPLPLPLRVEDYLLLDGAGAFGAYGKTELIDGEIVFVNAQHRPHGLVKMEMYDALRDALKAMGSVLRPMVETSVELSPHDAPEPDIVLTSEPVGEGLIPGDSVALVIEVSDSTIDFDLTHKAAVYARGDVPEYWVVDVKNRMIHQRWAPDGEAYGQEEVRPFGSLIVSATQAGLEVSTDAL